MRSQPLVAAALVLRAAAAWAGGADDQLAAQGQPPELASYGRLPLHFEANQGQTAEQVKFLARGRGYTLFLTSTESVLVLRSPEAAGPVNRVTPGKVVTSKRSTPSAILRLKLLGANPRPAVDGREELPGRSHYLIGSDRKRWRANVPQHARVEYREVYPGVGLTYYGNQGQLEYDFVVSPGADPGLIRLGIEGAGGMRLDADGSLRIGLKGGEVIQRAPVVYQEVGGVRKPVPGRFVLRGRTEVGFKVGRYDVNRPLVLDPVLLYSTYLGGSDEDQAIQVAVDTFGSAYVTGYTYSTDFPTENALQPTSGGVVDIFVAKLSASGSALVYSTYLGGHRFDLGAAIAVDSSGNAYITGSTSSDDFPTVNPLQPEKSGGSDAFVAKLNPAGSALIYSTYLGGNDMDDGFDIAVDAFGSAILTGQTLSTDFPTADPLQAANAGTFDAFVTKLNPAGSALVFSTYLGGSSTDLGFTAAVDASGNTYLAGATLSKNFPTANPLQGTSGGSTDAFVTKLNASGTALVYSTYLGGSLEDFGSGLAVDSLGQAFVVGYTSSANFPTRNAFQGANAGLDDAFVSKLSAAGSSLVSSTYLGGAGRDGGLGIALDGAGRAYVSGHTTSVNFPVREPLQGANAGSTDGFVAKLSESSMGRLALEYSTYLGGSGIDSGVRIAVDAAGNAYVIGYTNSIDFPLIGPIQDTNHGRGDLFVSKIGAGATDSVQGR